MNIPWQYYAIAAVMAAVLGTVPQMFIPLRHDAYTASDGRRVADRVRALEIAVAKLPPPTLISRIEVLKRDSHLMHEDLRELKRQVNELKGLIEKHMRDNRRSNG